MALTRGERFTDARTVYNKNGSQTMDEVKIATGISKSMIAALEDDNDNRSVGYDKVMLLAKHYGVSMDWLLGLAEMRTTNMTIRAISNFTGIDEDSIEALHLYSHPEKLSDESKNSKNNPVIQSVFNNARQKTDIDKFSTQVMVFINKILYTIVTNPRSLSSHFSQFVDLMKRQIKFEEENGPVDALELDILPKIAEDINAQGFEIMPNYCAAMWHLETATSRLIDLLYKGTNIELQRDLRSARVKEHTQSQRLSKKQ